MDSRLFDYATKIQKDFVQTAFGTFYLSNKKTIDGLIADVEFTMKQPDCDDASYLVKTASNSG